MSWDDGGIDNKEPIIINCIHAVNGICIISGRSANLYTCSECCGYEEDNKPCKEVKK